MRVREDAARSTPIGIPRHSAPRVGCLRALAEVGIDIETLDGAQVEAREPALKPGVAGGYFNPGDAQLRPDRYVAELARAVRARGGELQEQTRIESIEREGSRIACVRTTHGDYSARDVVFALGAWSPLLGRQLGLRLPIQPGKGYSITYSRPRTCPRVPLVLKEASVCVTAWNSGYRLGSTMEFAGYDSSLNRKRLDALAARPPRPTCVIRRVRRSGKNGTDGGR